VGYRRRRRRRRRPTPGAEAFFGLFAGDEHLPGIPDPSLPLRLCETEHPNPNLRLFGYLMPTNFEQSNFLQRLSGRTCVFSSFSFTTGY
jgi:hypothetical protein